LILKTHKKEKLIHLIKVRYWWEVALKDIPYLKREDTPYKTKRLEYSEISQRE